MSIARNLFSAASPIRARFLNRMDKDAMRVARDLLPPGRHREEHPPPRRSARSRRRAQAVAIARAMHFDSDLIILDEPTNNLGVAETQGVLRFVRNARDSGHSCIFIAHNIHHVFQVVDRIVVMRRGAGSWRTISTPSTRAWKRWSASSPVCQKAKSERRSVPSCCLDGVVRSYIRLLVAVGRRAA
jgi:ABC-type sugar transport system ATPase subunit